MFGDKHVRCGLNEDWSDLCVKCLEYSKPIWPTEGGRRKSGGSESSEGSESGESEWFFFQSMPMLLEEIQPTFHWLSIINITIFKFVFCVH